MYNATEQFAELNKAGVMQATKLAAIAIENAEKLARLNLSAAKVVLAQGVEGATATSSVKDVQDLLALRAKCRTGVQTAMTYSKASQISSGASAVSALAEEAWSPCSKGVASWVDKASKAAPAGTDQVSTRSVRRLPRRPPLSTGFRRRRSKSNLADASMRAAANTTKAAPKGRRAAK